MPLELLGAPSDPKNLWPQPQDRQPNDKDGLENYLHAQVCASRISLAEAQREIAADWYSAWIQTGRPGARAASAMPNLWPRPAKELVLAADLGLPTGLVTQTIGILARKGARKTYTGAVVRGTARCLAPGRDSRSPGRLVRSATSSPTCTIPSKSCSRAADRSSGCGLDQEPTLQLFRLLSGREAAEDRSDGCAERCHWRRVGWLPTEGLQQERVEVVPESSRLLSRKVSKEGALGDLSRLRDLIHGGGRVALVSKEAQRMPLDGGARLRLLAFSQAQRLASAVGGKRLLSRRVGSTGAGRTLARQEDQREHLTAGCDGCRDHEGCVHAGDKRIADRLEQGAGAQPVSHRNPTEDAVPDRRRRGRGEALGRHSSSIGFALTSQVRRRRGSSPIRQIGDHLSDEP